MPRKSDYHHPGQGGAQPRSGSLLLLSRGGICIFGPWVSDGRYLGWAPMPKRDRAKEAALAVQRNQMGRRMITA